MSNILVTGGTHGIGRGIVYSLAAEGHGVGWCGRSAVSASNAMLRELSEKFPGKFKAYQCDISSAPERQKLLEDFEHDFGCLDVLVNNAGVAPESRNDILDMTEESFDRVMSINLKGPFFLTQAAARMISKNTDGAFHCIINTGSISATFASINRGEYCISKAGVAMATSLWAARLAPLGIAVYELRPGIVHSDMTSCVAKKYDKLIAEGLTLVPRWGEPSDVGKAVAMLVNGTLAYSTGQIINIDGGMTVQRL